MREEPTSKQRRCTRSSGLVLACGLPRALILRGVEPEDGSLEVLNVDEAAALLRVNSETVRMLARDGRLPGRHVGKEWRFSRTALLAWLSQHEDDAARYQRPEGSTLEGEQSAAAHGPRDSDAEAPPP